jgi:hypothetical protein
MFRVLLNGILNQTVVEDGHTLKLVVHVHQATIQRSIVLGAEGKSQVARE